MSEWLPRKLVRARLMAPRPRGGNPKGPPDFWMELAKDVGEWAC